MTPDGRTPSLHFPTKFAFTPRLSSVCAILIREEARTPIDLSAKHARGAHTGDEEALGNHRNICYPSKINSWFKYKNTVVFLFNSSKLYSMSSILYVENSIEYVLSHRLSWLESARRAGFEVHVATLKGGGESRIKSENFEYYTISGGEFSKNPIDQLSLISGLFYLYKEVNPDIVHNVGLRAILYGGLVSVLGGGGKVVNTVTGLGYFFSESTYISRAIQKLIIIALRVFYSIGDNVFVFQNPSDRKLFLERNVVGSEESLVILGSGVDTDRFTPSPEPSGTPVVLFPARLIWPKGVKSFVESARRLDGRGVDARFVMVGRLDPENPASISRRQLQAWCEEGIVEWNGYVKDMPDMLSRSHIVCLPSTYREGVPKVLIEAAACGRPIVTTDMPGCREIVKDGRNGYLVPPKDVDELTKSLEKLIESKELRDKMGNRGRHIACREFSNEKVSDSLEKVYTKMGK